MLESHKASPMFVRFTSRGRPITDLSLLDDYRSPQRRLIEVMVAAATLDRVP